MEINLTWDLFIVVFFTVIVAYTFIIGQNKSVKIIISTYIAILASDAIGNLVNRYFIGNETVARSTAMISDANMLALIKIIIFILGIVILTTQGRFNINMNRSTTVTMRLVLGLSYGIFSAGILISTILLYASGSNLIAGQSGMMSDAITSIYHQSQLVRLMINYYDIWFSLPAIAFVLSSFSGDTEAVPAD